MGYHRAGFEVVGVDINPQPNYPFKFWQHDAFSFLQLDPPQDIRSNFDAIHASPPCQAYTTMNNRHGSSSPALIERTRWSICSMPYVIENVMGAKAEMGNPVMICGAAFGLGVGRHRLFETSFPWLTHACRCDGSELPVYGKLDGRRLWTRAGSELRAVNNLKEAQDAMGIDWMTWDELREAIPPAYTEHIGGYLLRDIRAKENAGVKKIRRGA